VLTLSDLSLAYGGRVLFRHVSFQLSAGDRCGLVGANGAGKTSLMRILLGEETADSGTVAMPKTARVGTLRQDQFLYEDQSLLDVVLQGNTELWAALQRKEALLSHEQFSEDECEELEQLEAVLQKHQGYAAEGEAGSLLAGLGLTSDRHHQPMRLLSGGYKLRVLLAQTLFAKPDVLLLDEPTNHLDIVSIRWLEQYLQSFPGVVLASSHDRDFLEQVCTCIADVDYGTVRLYPFGFKKFIEAKTAYREQQEALLETQQKRLDDMQGFVDRFRAKSSKARQAQSRVRMIEKLEGEMQQHALQPSSRQYPRFVFSQERPSGMVPLKVQGITKSFGEQQVLHGVSFEMDRGVRAGLIGPNGVGKSTLLKIIVGDLASDAGDVQLGHATRISYFSQDHEKVVQGKGTVLEWLRQAAPDVNDQAVRDSLGKALFCGTDADKPLKALSGGEKARLVLSKIMLESSNLLIFDEPTNHLDMEAIEALLEALHEFPGTLLFVSHNAYFVTQLAQHILEITPEGIRQFPGSYPEYLSTYEQDYLCKTTAARSSKGTKERNKSLSHEERRQERNTRNQLKKKIAQAEDLCHKLERRIADIDREMAQDGFYERPQVDVRAVIETRKELEQELNHALATWESLSSELDE